METSPVDFLFKGFHPAFFWASSLLVKKGKKVAILETQDGTQWTAFPKGILDELKLDHLKSDRNLQPVQVLTSHSRFSIYDDPVWTQDDFLFCTDGKVHAEWLRGLSYYSKGSDYPAVFGETAEDLLKAVQLVDYLDHPDSRVLKEAIQTLKKMGVFMIGQGQPVPDADQTFEIDYRQSRVFRSRHEFAHPLKTLPPGASSRMLFVEKNSPLIEMVHRDEWIYFNVLMSQEVDDWVEKVILAIDSYFPGVQWNTREIRITPQLDLHQEWMDTGKRSEIHQHGLTRISPMINPDLGIKSLYVRVLQALKLITKKEQLIDIKGI